MFRIWCLGFRVSITAILVNPTVSIPSRSEAHRDGSRYLSPFTFPKQSGNSKSEARNPKQAPNSKALFLHSPFGEKSRTAPPELSTNSLFPSSNSPIFVKSALQLCQSLTRRPDTRPNSATLCVTKVKWFADAIAAIMRSFGPIRLPASSNSCRIRP